MAVVIHTTVAVVTTDLMDSSVAVLLEVGPKVETLVIITSLTHHQALAVLERIITTIGDLMVVLVWLSLHITFDK